MSDKNLLAILVGALVAAGAAGCDTGEQREPASPDRDSTAMYGTEDQGTAQDPRSGTERLGDEAERLGERGMQAGERAGQRIEQGADELTGDRPYGTGDQASMAGLEAMSDQEIVGMTVISREGEEIGSIDEVVTDDTGGMGDKMAIIDAGGFLGIGEKTIAVPFDDLEVAADGRVQSSLTRETLESQPEYQRDQTRDRGGEQM